MTKKRTTKKKDCGKTRSPSGAVHKAKTKGASGSKEEGITIPHASHSLQQKLCPGSLRAQAGLPDRHTPESLSGTKVHNHLEKHFNEYTRNIPPELKPRSFQPETSC